MRSVIGGAFDPQQFAKLFRADDADTLRREAERLASQGLKPRDIGAALGISERAAESLLATALPGRQRPCSTDAGSGVVA